MNSYQQERLEKLQAIGAQTSRLAQAFGQNLEVDPGPAFAKFKSAAERARASNPWFTEAGIHAALNGIAYMLRPDATQEWLTKYSLQTSENNSKKVGLVLAGNIPMVGFHDLLSVYAAGHEAFVKPSAQDNVLMPALLDFLHGEIPDLNWKVTWREQRLGEIDAVIATGSNNTARYFEYYFGKYPHIIRKNRSSIAILTGKESDDELQALGDDIFQYFGLGCRNVSKLYLHESFDVDRLFKAMYPHNEIVNHHKYANNYDYYRALWMMNLEPILDNGFMILRESPAISSPVGTTFYERYTDLDNLRGQLHTREEEIQCVVSQADTPFGQAQKPELWDYADGVDTMGFLSGL